VETRSLYDTEYRVRRGDGEYRHLAVRGVPVLEPDGAIREWVGTCTDITERKRAETQLKAQSDEMALRARQLQALAAELTLAEQQERKRLALVLHDNLQQFLVGAKLSIGALRKGNSANESLVRSLGQVDDLLGESIQLCRLLVVELSPPILFESGLAAALRWLGAEMKRIHGLEVSVTGDAEIRPDKGGVVLLLFQTVRELLFNVVKHAGVKSAAVRIRRPNDGQVQIEIADEGAGMDTRALDRNKGSATGLGLLGIQKRISQIGGRMDLESAPGRGTRIVVVAGVNPSEDDATAAMPGGNAPVGNR
jgi:signal transduction histidine kinase